jgi:hypothetical protein
MSLRKYLPPVLIAGLTVAAWTVCGQENSRPCSEEPQILPHSAHESPERCDCGNFRTELRSPISFPDDPMPLVIAGAWEGDDPVRHDGTQIGILIKVEVVQKVRLAPATIARGFTAESKRPLEFWFYQRTAGEEQRAWRRVSGDSSTSLDGQRFQTIFKNWDNFTHTDVSLDVTFDRQQLAWTGKFTRNGVTKPIRLERPGASLRTKPDLLVGTWALSYSGTPEGNPVGPCLTIAQGRDGAFTAWEPSTGFQWIGLIIDGPPPSVATFWGSAGKRWGIEVTDQGVTLDQAAYVGGWAGGGPPMNFVGELAMCGREIIGRNVNLDAMPGQPRHGSPIVIWSKQSHGCYSLISVVPSVPE